MGTVMTRRALLLASGIVTATGLPLSAQTPRLNANDGYSHGDPPFLLEDGWTPLLNERNLNGWSFEHPEKGIWTNSAGLYWDSQRAPKELTALPGPGTRIANGRTGGNSNIYTKQKFGDVELYVEFLIPFLYVHFRLLPLTNILKIFYIIYNLICHVIVLL